MLAGDTYLDGLQAGMEALLKCLHTHLGIYVQLVITSSQAIARSMHRPGFGGSLLKLIARPTCMLVDDLHYQTVSSRGLLRTTTHLSSQSGPTFGRQVSQGAGNIVDIPDSRLIAAQLAQPSSTAQLLDFGSGRTFHSPLTTSCNSILIGQSICMCSILTSTHGPTATIWPKSSALRTIPTPSCARYFPISMPTTTHISGRLKKSPSLTFRPKRPKPSCPAAHRRPTNLPRAGAGPPRGPRGGRRWRQVHQTPLH